MSRHIPVVPEFVMSSIILSDTTSEKVQLLEAILKNDEDTVRELVINQGVKPHYGVQGNLAVCRAAMEGRDSILTLLLDNGGEADAADMTDFMWMRHPIHMAASSGRVGCLDILLTREVDVNSRDSDHRTALHWASTYGHTDAVEFLISRGASVNTAQIDGFTALHAASCLGHVEVCRSLIQHGADVSRADRDSWTALHTSVCYGYIDIVTAILDAGASIHQRTSDAETAFHIACSSGHLDIARLLYNHGAQINVRNINGYTPFHLSVYFAKYSLVHFLVTVNADMDTANSAGQSPLYLAVLREQHHVVQLMVEAGCRVDLPALMPLTSKLSEDVLEHIQYLGTNPRCLRDLCCIRVRTLLKHTLLEDVALLPIPTTLKNLLLFKHLCGPS